MALLFREGSEKRERLKLAVTFLKVRIGMLHLIKYASQQCAKLVRSCQALEKGPNRRMGRVSVFAILGKREEAQSLTAEVATSRHPKDRMVCSLIADVHQVSRIRSAQSTLDTSLDSHSAEVQTPTKSCLTKSCSAHHEASGADCRGPSGSSPNRR
ncbi:hypothetical protein TcasGA2_TC010524 [Tribolium castaneum]|uniref:Uncharacterized protein n=1 Tax=Tribolium castaneum TaxID=7070 RepID=D6WDX5_TRICA|nr:hypothetical protein TcasGA2_TC010524 [Tribolium castaneum]